MNPSNVSNLALQPVGIACAIPSAPVPATPQHIAPRPIIAPRLPTLAVIQPNIQPTRITSVAWLAGLYPRSEHSSAVSTGIDQARPAAYTALPPIDLLLTEAQADARLFLARLQQSRLRLVPPIPPRPAKNAASICQEALSMLHRVFGVPAILPTNDVIRPQLGFFRASMIKRGWRIWVSERRGRAEIMAIVDKAGVPTASSARGADIVLQPVEKCSVSTEEWARIARQEADGGCGEVVDPAWWKQCLQTGMMHITPKMESMPWRTI